MMDQHEELQIELAHRERRRADRLLKALRFEEAIVAHEEATLHLEKVNFIDNSMLVRYRMIQLFKNLSSCKSLFTIVKSRWCATNRSYNEISKRGIRRFYTSADTIELAEMALPDCADSVGTSTRFKPQDFRESFTKQLHSITDRNDELLLQIYKTISKSNESINGSTSNLLENGQVIEELRTNNFEIRRVFDSMAESYDKLQQRNKQLENEVEILRAKLRLLEKAPTSGPDDRADQSLPELPPLERPTFEGFSTSTTSLFS
ncbi:nuclear receptor-binding factor 2-like isoform X3 [Varroa jacobsoni]|nr:nuclear receptor-binding factor 2-like isoform X3 [Varroa jacobsoni]XP_022703817.1 nuclear receptor-binding factor 2-like isoform X3 [Varroa jacobsoni]XP_022703818.1 nuclear receptor-binding factor 2-like isoform X3 [Varroa jacobsoni]XP_022703819.1 nuclear receptor-binding factor 2-like isoform X3 [Varroa jacobsoni]